MKKITVMAMAAALFAVACKENKTDNVTTAAEQTVAAEKGSTYHVDGTATTVKWTAYHKGGLNPRFGIMKAEGSLTAENGALTSGNLTSDVNSLTTDPKSVDPATSEGKTSVDLDTHLKSADFFDAAKYPAVKFAITKVEELPADADKSKVEGANKLVSGNLTLKDKTLNVSFPAKVEVTDNQVSVVSKFTVNRADWGLTYGAEGNPADWMISKDIDLDLNIVAKK